MLPVLATLQVGDSTVTIGAYATFLVLAAVVAIALGVLGARRAGVATGAAIAGLVIAVAAGIASARLFDLVLSWPSYAGDPGQILSPAPRNFVLYGGFLGGIGAVLLVSRAWRVSVAALADRWIPAVVAGIALLRVGCFLNGCCAGVVTDLPWGVVFPVHPSTGDAQTFGGFGFLAVTEAPAAVHPTQLYEIVAVLACGAIAWLVKRRGAAPGVPALAFAVAFLAFRAAIQLVRAPSGDPSIPPGWIPAIYAVAAVCAALLLVRSMRGRRPGTPVTSDAEAPGDAVRAAGALSASS